MKRAAVHCLVYAFATLGLLPLASTLITSFSASASLEFDDWTLDHYRTFFAGGAAARWITNSIFFASVYTVGVVLLSSAAGFALAKYDFAGKRFAAVVVYLTMLMPTQVLLPATRELVSTLGWIDTFAAVVVPGLASAFGVFLYASAFRQVADELLDAARVDGCGEVQLWWQIGLPAVRPMTAAYTLLSFVASWNALLWPQLVLRSESRQTLPIGLANWSGLSQWDPSAGVLMAGTVVSVLPVMVVFLVLQKEFVSGLSSGAVKG